MSDDGRKRAYGRDRAEWEIGARGRSLRVRTGRLAHAGGANTGLAAEPTSDGWCCGSVTIVPPWPSLARLKSLAEYWPRRVRLAVCVPSVTVSVPLRLFLSSDEFARFVHVKRIESAVSIDANRIGKNE